MAAPRDSHDTVPSDGMEGIEETGAAPLVAPRDGQHVRTQTPVSTAAGLPGGRSDASLQIPSISSLMETPVRELVQQGGTTPSDSSASSPLEMRRAHQSQAPLSGDKQYLLSSEYRKRFASLWKSFASMDDFAQFARWTKDVTDDKRRETMISGARLHDYIVGQGNFNLGLVQKGLMEANMASGIDYTELVVGEKCNENRAFFYLAFYAFGRGYDPNCLKQYQQFLRHHFPLSVKLEGESLPRTAVDIGLEKAFRPQPVIDREVVEPLHEEITKRFTMYTKKLFLSPYCALIGPSGVGKSYAIREIAHSTKQYVAYVNFGSSIESFPKRSLMADLFVPLKKGADSGNQPKEDSDEQTNVDPPESRSDYTTWCEAYIAYCILSVEICREYGLSEKCYYDLQTQPRFSQFQQKMMVHVKTLFLKVNGCWNPTGESEAALKRIHSEPNFDYQEYIARFMVEFKKDILDDFKAVIEEISNLPADLGYRKQGVPEYEIKDGELGVLLCFDEAGALFAQGEPYNQSRFVALRRALRHQATVSDTKPFKRFYGIFVDTASRVSEFHPSTERDFSQTRGRDAPTDLMKPIFGPNTFDLVAPSSNFHMPYRKSENQSAHVQSLFSYGRPLWHRLFKANLSLDNVIDVASKRTRAVPGPNEAPTPTQALALLSYRLQFSIVYQALAEELSNSHLRYVVDVNPQKTMIRTLQPSEPILAYVAAREMTMKAQTRLAIVRVLYNHTCGGYIHIGDIGEVVATLLIMFAYDTVHGNGLPQPIKFADFFRILLNDALMVNVESAMNDHPKLKTLLEDGMVFFNHFVRVRDKITTSILTKAWQRGAAILPATSAKGCDIVVPIAMPNRDAPKVQYAWTMTYLIVQVKNRRDDTLSEGRRNEARDALKSALGDLPRPKPHVGLFMSLRSKDSRGEASMPYPLQRRQLNPATRAAAAFHRNERGNRGSQYYFNEGDTARVVVATTGLTRDIYNVLNHIAPSADPRADPSSDDPLHWLNSLLKCREDYPMKEEEEDDYIRQLFPVDIKHLLTGKLDRICLPGRY